MVWWRMTEFGTCGNRVIGEEKHNYRGQPYPHPKGPAPPPPKKKILWYSYLRLNGLTYSDEIWYDSKWEVACFRGSATPHHKGWDSSIPHIFETFNMRAHSMNKKLSWCWQTRMTPCYIYNWVGRCAADLLHIFSFQNGGRLLSGILYFPNFCEKKLNLRLYFRHHANFGEDQVMCGQIIAYFRFSKWRPSAILDLVWCYSRPPMTCVWWS